MSKVGENIMELRKSLGWTQEELAKRMGYKSKSTINKIEMGINDIPQSKIVKFAEVLGTSPARLMGWVNEETNKKNDDLVRIIAKLRTEPELLEVVSIMSDAQLSAEQYAAIKQLLLTAFVNK